MACSPVGGATDIDKLLHDLEFENQQYVKEIEKERQLKEYMENTLRDVNEETKRQQGLPADLDLDIKRQHKQFTSNRDNILSLRNTLKMLEKHEVTLKVKLEDVKKSNNENLRQRSSMLQMYENVWEDYQGVYNSFPLSIDLKHELQHKDDLVNRCKEAENRSGILQREIMKIKDDFTPYTKLNEFIVKFSTDRLTLQTIQRRIAESDASCGELISRRKAQEQARLQREEQARRKAQQEAAAQKAAQKAAQLANDQALPVQPNQGPVIVTCESQKPKLFDWKRDTNQAPVRLHVPQLTVPALRTPSIRPQTMVQHRPLSVPPSRGLIELRPNVQLQTPMVHSISVQPQAPTIPYVQPQTPMISHVQPQTPTIPHVQPQTPRVQYSPNIQLQTTLAQRSPIVQPHTALIQQSPVVQKYIPMVNRSPIVQAQASETFQSDSPNGKPCSEAKTPESKAKQAQGTRTEKSPFDLERQLQKIKMLSTQSPGSGFTFEGRSMFDQEDEGKDDADTNSVGSFGDVFMKSMFVRQDDKETDHGDCKSPATPGFSFGGAGPSDDADGGDTPGAFFSMFAASGDKPEDTTQDSSPGGFFNFGQNDNSDSFDSKQTFSFF